MLILLPPSEGKTQAAAGDPVDLSGLWLPALTAARRRAMTRLVALCGRTSRRGREAALAALGLTTGQDAELVRNASLPQAPAAPAAEVYSGVLYEALDRRTLGPGARAWVDERVVVASALWGAVRLTDRIPAYRCSAGARLPVLGAMGAYWRKALRPAFDQAVGEGPVLDLRSGAYAAMWAPTGAVAARTAVVRVLHERVVDGASRRSVVSHFNKATKGRLVRALATAAARPDSVDAIVAALRDLGHTVEEGPARLDRPRCLDLIVTEV